jgi:hypothetical protein
MSEIKRPEFLERFEAKIERVTESGCWIWMGATQKADYGAIAINRKPQPAHRVFYKLFRGMIPQGMYVCHRCDVSLCVNPEHLFLGTQLDNIRDAKRKNRIPAGKSHGQAKLTEDDVREIRSSSGGTVRLARQYGVSHQLISQIRSGQIWKSLA